MSDVSVFETCTAQYTTDELDSLLQCISDGSAAVSNKKSIVLIGMIVLYYYFSTVWAKNE
jgi:hypothetical protein